MGVTVKNGVKEYDGFTDEELNRWHEDKFVKAVISSRPFKAWLLRRDILEKEQKSKNEVVYKLFIRRYEIFKKDYVVDVEYVRCDNKKDLYAYIGWKYSNTLEEIKRIDYKEIEPEDGIKTYKINSEGFKVQNG